MYKRLAGIAGAAMLFMIPALPADAFAARHGRALMAAEQSSVELAQYFYRGPYRYGYGYRAPYRYYGYRPYAYPAYRYRPPYLYAPPYAYGPYYGPGYNYGLFEARRDLQWRNGG